MMKCVRFAIAGSFLAVLLVFPSQFAHGKDQWTQVRSQNFLLIGNAPERDIRKVATRLEQFRETFRQAFRGMSVSSAIPTNVVVFKNDSAFKNFKPKRAGGRIDTGVAGYFQAGEDVNYIALSMQGTDEETFGTIFHEFVHNIVDLNFGRSAVPAWFNEGLAEYYQTFEIVEDQTVRVGRFQPQHLWVLQQTELIPLAELFKVSNHQLGESGNHSRSIFYAQSWALMHYLLQSGKTDQLRKFLSAITAEVEPRDAFERAFETTYERMEADLRNYVKQRKYNFHQVTFRNKLIFDTTMSALPLNEAATNAYLGDLLYHANQWDDAEPFLLAALSADPGSGMANTAMGMVKIRQGKLDQAKPYLENAVSADVKNYNALYRYAFLLSRELQDASGTVHGIDPDRAGKIRTVLKKAILLNPAFTPSYELLAFVSLVNEEGLDEGAALLRTALKISPGDEPVLLRLGEILSRQGKLDEAREIAAKLIGSSSTEIQARAKYLLNYVAKVRTVTENQTVEPYRTGRAPTRRRIETEAPPTEAEISKMEEDFKLRSANRALRALATGETRLIGRVLRIECKAGPIKFHINAASDAFTLTSPDFQSLNIHTFVKLGDKTQVGCDEDLSAFDAVITFRPNARSKPPLRGTIVSLEFVPAGFRFLTPEEMGVDPYIVHKEVPNR